MTTPLAESGTQRPDARIGYADTAPVYSPQGIDPSPPPLLPPTAPLPPPPPPWLPALPPPPPPPPEPSSSPPAPPPPPPLPDSPNLQATRPITITPTAAQPTTTLMTSTASHPSPVSAPVSVSTVLSTGPSGTGSEMLPGLGPPSSGIDLPLTVGLAAVLGGVVLFLGIFVAVAYRVERARSRAGEAMDREKGKEERQVLVVVDDGS
ncbi:hypothetical protein VTK56DRAFT_3112 [Thermocarpiscus australiensis]